MSVTIPIRAIELTPGSMISIHNLSWQDFEQVLAELGEQRSTRIAYYRGTLEIMSPLALHERPHRIIADIVKAILDAQGRDSPAPSRLRRFVKGFFRIFAIS